MKKILSILLLVFLFSCTRTEKPVFPKYKNDQYVHFTQPGVNKIDTLFGQIDMGIINEPVLWDDSTYKYRIKYKISNGVLEIVWINEKSIIGK